MIDAHKIAPVAILSIVSVLAVVGLVLSFTDDDVTGMPTAVERSASVRRGHDLRSEVLGMARSRSTDRSLHSSTPLMGRSRSYQQLQEGPFSSPRYSTQRSTRASTPLMGRSRGTRGINEGSTVIQRDG